MNKRSLKETKISQTTLYRSPFLTLYRDEVRLPDGGCSERLYIDHRGAAAMIAEVQKDHFLFVEQYRYAVKKTMLEIPAGRRDQRENFLKTARRELLEETGYVSKKWRRLGVIHPCIGYASEKIEIFYAQDLVFKKQDLDEGEFLNIKILSRSEIQRLIKSGKITDAKTLAAWQLYLGFRSR